jgi:hypothetical protein
VFLLLIDETYLEQMEPVSKLKIMICRKYSFQKPMQLSQRDNVLDAPASNIDSFLQRDTCVSSTELNRPLEQNGTVSQLKTLFCRKYSFKQ